MDKINSQVRLIATLSGSFTEGRLRQIGFDLPAIRRATRIGLIESVGHGILRTLPHRLRMGKLRTLGEAPELQPGQQVQQVIDGQMKTFQVVQNQGGRLVLIDIENPDAGTVEVDAQAVAPTAADPDRPQDAPAPSEDDLPPDPGTSAPEKTPYV